MAPKRKRGKSLIEKPPDGEVSDVDKDRISALPDALIHQIFDFLCMKEVVRTCILSKRWQYVWSSTPNLGFDLDCWPSSFLSWPEDFESFIYFVDNVVSRRRGSNIFKFELNSSIPHFHLCLTYIASWIRKVLECGVQHLILTFPLDTLGPHTLDLPHDLFTSSVRVLKVLIGRSPPESIVPLPNIPMGSQIKDLQLYGIKFPGGDVNGELVLNFSVLENLGIDRCDVNGLKVLTISTPVLQKLLVCLAAWRHDSCKVGVKIYSPKVVSLTLSTWWSENECAVSYSIEEELLSLVDANVRIDTNVKEGDFTKEGELSEDCSRRLMNILLRIYTARMLTMTYFSEKVLTEVRALKEKLPHGFPNLRYIMLVDGTEDPCHHAVLNFLESFPLLETIVWRRTLEGFSREPILFPEAEEFVPNQSIFTCLKTVEVRGVYGSRFELNFIPIILKRAIQLNELIINFHSRLPCEKVAILKEKFLSYPHVSTNVSLRFFRGANVAC
ncbi:hypothetical protein ACHQM5_028269 [Ranunculus cassubicifolius]